MKKYKAIFNETYNGKVAQKEGIFKVQGKDLTDEVIFKRLSNNLKTWQTAWNKYRIDKINYELIRYEEI